MLKKLFEGSIGIVLLAAVVGWSNGGNLWVYDRWWDLTTGRKLGEVDRLVRADKPAEALAALREHLRRDPADRRLLYRAAGLYLEMGRPLPAFAALAAYRDAAVESDTEKKSARYELVNTHWGALTGSDSRSPNRALLHDAAERWNSSVRIYNTAPQDWRRLAKNYSVPAILGAPILRTPLTQGLLSPGGAPLICYDPKECAASYRDARADGALGAALAAGRIAIAAPADPACCVISLDDPDLRPMDDVTAEYFAARGIRGAADIGKTPESLNELLELNSRLAIKHLFVLNFIYNASPPLRR